MSTGLKLTVAAVAIAAAGAGYYVSQHPESIKSLGLTTVASGPKAVDFVPADSLFFLGGLTPSSWTDSLKLLTRQQTSLPLEQWQSIMAEILDAPKPDVATEKELSEPGARFFLALLLEYMTELKTPETLVTKLGLNEQADGAVYSVGPLPVVRYNLSNEQAFKDFLARAEKRAGVTAVAAKYQDVNYSTYLLSKAGEANPVSLAVAIRDGFVVMTLDVGDLIPKEQGLAVALGSTKPTTSLAASGHLQKLVKDYALDPRAMGYLNHQALAASLTNPKSLLNGLLDKLAKAPDESLTTLRSEACQKDFAAITTLWPQSLFGYTKLDLTSQPIKADGLFQIESTDVATTQELQKMRGFIPSMVSSEQTWFGLGLGFNLDAMAPALSSLWTRFTQAPFACEPLKKLQQEVSGQNPMMLGMMTGMVQGLQGVSFSLTDLKLTTGASVAEMPKLQALSAHLTLSAKDPKKLWDTAAAMQPMIAAVPFPEQGKAVDLPFPLPPEIPVKLKLGLYGTNLVLFTGDAAAQKQAEALASEPSAANGLYQVAVNYRPLLNLAKPWLEMAAKDTELNKEQQSMIAELQKMSNQDIRVKAGLDFDAKGIKLFYQSVLSQPAAK